jgi:hypothetical protein
MNKYLYLSIGLLIFVLVVIYLVTVNKLKPAQTNTASPTPTVYQTGTKNTASGSSREQSARAIAEVIRMTPVETEDFIIDYSPNLNKIVVTRKTNEADFIFPIWARENGVEVLVNNNETTIISDKSMEQVQTPYISQSPKQQLDAVNGFFSVILSR